MPSSQHIQISDIIDVIYKLKPSSVLDIGIGFGKYGFLCREYLELWDGRKVYDDWNHRIDGIEVFPDYISDLQQKIYSNIYIGDALEILPSIDCKYDLVLLIDVFEHFDYDNGMQLLNVIKEKSRNVLISVPKDIGDQGAAFGNVYETHRYQWTDECTGVFKKCRLIDNDKSYIWACGKDLKRLDGSGILKRITSKLK